MDLEHESAEADDFDLTAALSAEFDNADTPDVVEPIEETAEQTADRVRDEKGRFAPKAEEAVKEAPEAPSVAVAAKPAEAVAVPVEPAPAAGEPLRAPPGWSPTAKAAFADLPADHPIKLAVAQREVEINKGFEKLAEYKPVERFAEMAKRSGTTLDKALESYVGIEQELGRDFIGGIGQICRNKGVDPVSLANAILARNGVSSAQQDEASAPAHQTSQQIDPNAIAATVRAQLQQEREQEDVARSIKEFGADPKNQFFENVRADMGRLIGAGYAETIPEAYEKACWANSEIRSLLIKQQNTVSDASAKAAAGNQARAASKSITGSPVPGASGKEPSMSIEDEIRQLMDESV